MSSETVADLNSANQYTSGETFEFDSNGNYLGQIDTYVSYNTNGTVASETVADLNAAGQYTMPLLGRPLVVNLPESGSCCRNPLRLQLARSTGRREWVCSDGPTRACRHTQAKEG